MNRKYVVSCVCASVGAAWAALAADVVVDNYERGTAVAEADESLGSAFVAPQAAGIDKTGAGTLTLPLASIETRTPVQVSALQGKVSLTEGEFGAFDPPACLLKAKVWFDASKTETLAPPSGVTDGSVEYWYDVRETKDASGNWKTGYSRLWSSSGPKPVKKTDSETGRNYLDFNGAGSGSSMAVLNTGGGAQRVSAIRHLFMAGKTVNAWGWPLSCNGWSGQGNRVFWEPFGGYSLGAPLWSQSVSLPGVFAGYNYYNGVLVDPAQEKTVAGPYCYEWDSGYLRGHFEHLFDGQYFPERKGGDSLGELIVFTVPLTAEERQQVAEYMMRKWKAAAAPGKVSVCTAKGATLEVAEGVEVTVEGEGTFMPANGGTYGYSQTKPYLGDVRVPAGSVTLNDAEPTLALGVEEDVRVLRNDTDQLTVSRAALAKDETTQLTIDSNATVRVAALPQGVKTLKAKGAGTLVLSGSREETYLRAGGDLYATMWNAGFEKYTEMASTSISWCGVTGSGWWGWTFASGGFGFVNLKNLRTAGGDGNSWRVVGGGVPKDAIDAVRYPFEGETVLLVYGASVAENKVTFPKAGAYELTFLSAGRVDGNYAGWLKLSLVRNETTIDLGTAVCYSLPSMNRHRIRIPHVEAGEYTFRLTHDTGGEDSSTIVDDFKFRFVPEIGQETVFRPPNGDFERLAPTWSGRLARDRGNVLADWTLTESATGAAGTPDMCAVLPGMTDVAYGWSGSEYGGVQLAVYGNGGTATSAAFELPAGSWRLRCRSGSVYCNDYGTYGWNGYATARDSANSLRAKLIKPADGAELQLGSTETWNTQTFKTRTFSGVVTFAEPTTVRLQLVQTEPKDDASKLVPCVLVDDLEFVRVEREGEVIANSKVLNAENWTFAANYDASVPQLKKAFVGVHNPTMAMGQPPYETSAPYGTQLGVSATALDFCQNGTATQSVTFPSAGVYRLEFSSRGRIWEGLTSEWTDTQYAGNQLQFFLRDANGVETEIYRSPSICSRFFTFRSALFRVTTPGTCTFGIRSLNGLPLGDGTYLQVGNNADDCEVFVDQVSVRKVESADTAPSLPEDLMLQLDRGMKLRLDYVGTNTIERLRVNGQYVTGVVDASHSSGLVSGTGALKVTTCGPRVGMSIICK